MALHGTPAALRLLSAPELLGQAVHPPDINSQLFLQNANGVNLRNRRPAG